MRGKLGLGESYTAGEWDADDLVALFELLLRNADAAAERHARLRGLLDAPAPPPPTQRSRPVAPEHRLPLRPRQRAVRALARRDDDLLVRVFERPEADARGGPAARSWTGSAAARARPGRSRPRDRLRLGQLRAARRRGAWLPRHRHHDLARAGSRRARAHAPVLPVEILEQDYRDCRRPVHEGRLDRDAGGDRRATIRNLLRDDRPRARARRPGGRADDLVPDAALGPLPPRRPTGSSATSSPAA